MKRLALGLSLLILAGAAMHAASQEKISVEDLKIRSQAGDRGATRSLAEAYYTGRGGVEQDFQEAARWYRRLASQGDARAQTSLGLMYARGLGFEKNLGEARKWWSLAAAQNDPGAQHNLGMVYLEGQGVAPDPAQAFHWISRAAASGHVLAQHNLGLMYREGRGTARDDVAGLAWLMIAADAGDEKAEETVKTLAASMPPEQISEARARAKSYAAKRGGKAR